MYSVNLVCSCWYIRLLKFRNMVVSNGNVDMEEGTLEIGMGMHFLVIPVQLYFTI
jgi:hypothetical protein